MYERRRRLRVVAVIVLGVALIVACLGVLVLKARSNYIAGQRALAAGQYGLAIQRLSAAEVIGRPYANAHALLNDAVALSFSQAEYTTALHGSTRPTAATLTLRRAAALFQAGHYPEAQALVAGLTSRVPAAVATRLSTTGSSAAAALLLLVAGDQALAAGNWGTARADAQSVLLRYPRCAPAAALSAEAARRQRAQPLALHAAALVAAGHWAAARKVARQTLRVDPTYPGAAALLARIDATLASRKAAAKAKAAATSTAPTSTATTAPAPVTPAPPAPQPPPP